MSAIDHVAGGSDNTFLPVPNGGRQKLQALFSPCANECEDEQRNGLHS